jgi:multidrug efflux system membrane fusion protein
MKLYQPLLFSVLILGAGMATALAQAEAGQGTKTPPVGPKAGGKGGRLNLPTSISTAVVTAGDLEIRVSALGSVKALNNVTVRPRVEGQLMKVHYTEGQAIKAGDPLAEIDPRPFEVQLMQSEGQLARDRAALANAKLDLKRYQDAAEAVTRQQLDSAGALVAQLEGTVKADEGSVNNARLQLQYCHVTAPISGTVGLRPIDAGNVVSQNDPTGLAVITQLQPISVIFGVPEGDIPAVQYAVSRGAVLRVEAFDRDGKNILATGDLAALDNQIDATTGTLRLRAQFANADRRLFPNQFVNVRLTVENRKGVLLVPTAAVQISDLVRYVFVVNGQEADATVTRRTVKTGAVDGLNTEITEGLAAGEIIAADGLDRLQDKTKVLVPGRRKGPVNPEAKPAK